MSCQVADPLDRVVSPLGTGESLKPTEVVPQHSNILESTAHISGLRRAAGPQGIWSFKNREISKENSQPLSIESD